MLIFCGIILRMRYVSGKICRENQNTRIMFSNFPEKSCRLWDNVGQYGRATLDTDGSIIRRMRIACRMISPQVRTQNMWYLLVFHTNSGYANVAQCYVHTYVTCLVFLMLMSCKVFGSDMVEGWAMLRAGRVTHIGAEEPSWGLKWSCCCFHMCGLPYGPACVPDSN
jgi:hypothetical protein